MLKRLHVRNFTVFAEADFEFRPGLNVIVGTNGTGKSHVLKLGYAVEYVHQEHASKMVGTLNGTFLEAYANDRHVSWGLRLATYLPEIFLIDKIGDIVRYAPETKATVKAIFKSDGDIDDEVNFSLDPLENNIGFVASPIIDDIEKAEPLFIPAKEVLSFFRGFGSVNRKFRLSFDLTYAHLVDALELPLLRNPQSAVAGVMHSIEQIVGGRISLENGQFYLYQDNGTRLEINLVAEGIRKFGMLAQLLANGSLTKETTLFWDEPEANLNPALLRQLAALLVQLAGQGFQIILATHSLFLLKEFHILAHEQKTTVRYFGLSAAPGEATRVTRTDDLELLPDIVALDAELAQSDRFLDVLNQEDASA